MSRYMSTLSIVLVKINDDNLPLSHLRAKVVYLVPVFAKEVKAETTKSGTG